ncbi:unnamed protein product [Calypogeia fissa]
MEFLQVLMVLMVLKILATCILGDVLSDCKIDKCLAADLDAKDLNCTTKMIVLLSITSGKLGESDSLQFMVPKTKDASGLYKEISRPYSIQIAKSDVYFNYPLFYTRSYNQKPYETFAYKTSCDDGSEWAICEWMKDAKGEHIPESNVSDSDFAYGKLLNPI